MEATLFSRLKRVLDARARAREILRLNKRQRSPSAPLPALRSVLARQGLMDAKCHALRRCSVDIHVVSPPRDTRFIPSTASINRARLCL